MGGVAAVDQAWLETVVSYKTVSYIPHSPLSNIQDIYRLHFE
jgi:hypothetical protein